MSQPRAITLLELMVAIMVVAVLVALSVPKFAAMKERGLNKEAKANLKLIQAAEKIYQMEVGVFWPDDSTTANISSLNANLRVDLSAANWDYSVVDNTSGAGPLDAQAGRDSGSVPAHWQRRYYIDESTDQACCCAQGAAPDSACPSEDLCTNLGEDCPPVW